MLISIANISNQNQGSIQGVKRKIWPQTDEFWATKFFSKRNGFLKAGLYEQALATVTRQETFSIQKRSQSISAV